MIFKENQLTYEEYIALRGSVGWNNFFEEQTRKSIANSVYIVTAFENEEMIGMGRLIGDGMYYLIVDVIVNPIYQG